MIDDSRPFLGKKYKINNRLPHSIYCDLSLPSMFHFALVVAIFTALCVARNTFYDTTLVF